MKAGKWLAGWLIIVITVFSICGFLVYRTDPYFHYHKPDLNKYYYTLNNQRSQNDGIIKRFDYDAMITGSSMIANFRTSEMDRLFGCNSIKTGFNGASYKEVNDNIEKALEVNPDMKTVVRSLDMSIFFSPYDAMAYEPGIYPTYLYDSDPLNDIEYLLNRDVVFARSAQMLLDKLKKDFEPGIDGFDGYSRWQSMFDFGIGSVCPEGISEEETPQKHISDEEKEIIKKNVEINVVNAAEANPDVDFYYFYTPYSAVKWNNWKSEGALCKFLEAEEYMTELIVPHKNIHLFSFNGRTDITTDLNNYKDDAHYAIWINSLMLKWMHDGKYRLTEDNYKERLKEEYDFYTSFDYGILNGQEDYEADYYAAALLNEELTGAKPLDVTGAGIIEHSDGKASFTVDLDDGYNYLSVDVRKKNDSDKSGVYVYDENGGMIAEAEADQADTDDKVHQYVLDLSEACGKVKVVLDSGSEKNEKNGTPDLKFSNICMY